MSVIAKLKVWLGADTKNLEQGMKRSKQQVTLLSKVGSRLGSVIAGAFAVDAVVAFTNECRRLWAVQEKAEKKLEAVHKATQGASEMSVDQLKRFASELQGLTTIGDEVSINAMAMMSSFKSIKGDVFKEAMKAALDMSQVMGNDLKSSILQVGKALESPEIGMSALREVGVSFTLEQIKYVRELIAQGKKQEAQLIILRELQTEYGGASAAAADTATGAAEQLTNALGDQKEIIGKLLTPSKEFYHILTDVVVANNNLMSEISGWSILAAYIKDIATLGFGNNVQALKTEAMAIQQNRAANEDLIETLQLRYKTKEQLHKLERELVTSTLKYEDQGVDWSQAIEAVQAEIKKRQQGIKATNKAAEAKAQAAAQEKAQEEAHLKRIYEIKTLDESSLKAVTDKIAAFQRLTKETAFSDTASIDYYNAEIDRLNKLIAKQKQFANERYFKAHPKESVITPHASLSSDLETEAIANGFEQEIFQDASIDKLALGLQNITTFSQEASQSFIDLGAIANDSLSLMGEGLGASLGMLVTGEGSVRSFASVIAGSFADMAINVGKTAIKMGIATTAIFKALQNPSLGPLAIAAGVALVALGTAIRASLSDIATGGSGGSSGGAFSSGLSNSVDARTMPVPTTQDYERQQIKVSVTGELKARGNQLVAAISSENNRKRLTT